VQSYEIIDGRVYCAGQSLGLASVTVDGFRILHDTTDSVKDPLNNAFITGLCEFGQGDVLVSGYGTGFAIANESDFVFWDTPASHRCKSLMVKGVTRLSPDRFAATCEIGVLFFNADGEIEDYIGPQNGEGIGSCRNRAIVDKDNVMWIPMRHTGPLARLDLQSQTRRLAPMDHRVEWIEQHRDQLLFSCGQEVREFNVSETSNPVPTDLKPGILHHSLDAVCTEDELLFSLTNGLAGIDADGQTFQIDVGQYLTNGVYLPKHKLTLFGTTDSGIHVFRKTDGQWESLGNLPGAKGRCVDLVTNSDESEIWFQTDVNVVGRLIPTRVNLSRHPFLRNPGEMPPQEPAAVNVSTDSSDSLVSFPTVYSTRSSSMVFWKDRLLFASNAGLLEFDPIEDVFTRFVPISDELKFLERRIVSTLTVDPHDNLWLATNESELMRIRANGEADWPVGLLPGDVVAAIISSQRDDTISVLTVRNELIRFALNFPRMMGTPGVRIHATLNDETENENPLGRATIPSGMLFDGSEVPFGGGSVRFQYASLSQNLAPTNSYQYRLRGFSDEWSEWSNQPEQQYHALPTGAYTFEARARSRAFKLGPVSRIHFSVAPPWYTSSRALLSYGIGLAFVTGGLVQWGRHNSRRQVQRLQHVVSEQTSDLKQSQERYQWLVEGLNELYIFTSLNGSKRITFVSPSVQQVLGYKPEDMIHKRWNDFLLPGEALPSLPEPTTENGRTDSQVAVGDVRVRHADGTLRHLEFALFPVRNRRGIGEAVDCIARDVTEPRKVQEWLEDARVILERRVAERTEQLRLLNAQLQSEIVERRQAEMHLKESELRYRSIVQDQSEMIVRFDNQGKITFANKAYCDANGATADELIGQPYFFRIHEDDREDVVRIVESAGQDVQSEHVSSSRAIRPDGSVAWEAWTGRVLIDSDGRRIGFQAVGRDITQLHEAQRKLHEKEQQLAHLARVSTLGEMVAGISHEINQPLATISNFSSAAMMMMDQNAWTDSDREKLRIWIERISRQTERINAIIQRLKRFGRPGSQSEPFLIVDAINEAVMVTETRTRDAIDQLDIDCPADLPMVFADRVQIEQVLVNLIRNACDAVERLSAGERTLRIGARLTDGFVTVTVTDSGPGIPEEVASNIFESFVTSKIEGMGVGLAISRSIIDANGGRIRVVPENGTGCFEFTIPTSKPGNE
ncbi:MAG: PAS domain S-box protein, partial [Planctomycetaceae bacterium]|nr:PAS domain S-box protein [Planctomycetaceae bacterium]